MPENNKPRVLKNIANHLLDFELKETFYYLKFAQKAKLKADKFLSFFKTNCKITNNMYDINNLYKLKGIKRFICNTDVTWCKNGKYGYDRGFLCDFPNMKTGDNIAYSIDFGSGKLDKKKKKSLKKYAKNFKHISVRNIFRIEEFKEVTDRDDAVITIDPTFLIDSSDYDKIAKMPDNLKDYVLVYNCQENDPRIQQKAEEYAKKNGKKVVVIDCYVKFFSGYKNLNISMQGIDEFLGLVKNADCVFTNSYHGICFSIIYKKNFVAFGRKANPDKINTLLELFSLYDCMYSEEDELKIHKIDYDKVYKKLYKYRDEADAFLKTALNK